MPQLEIAVTSLQDALRAAEGGADSIEVSRDLPHGGLTPPVELVRSILADFSLPVHVIVRPNARSFVYTAEDVKTILRETRQFAELGAASIVFGAVRADNHLDVELIRQIAQAIAPTPVTVHRALDRSAAPEASLRALIGGVPRILTAGPASNAWEGRAVTKTWVEQFGQHFEFVLSGGIRLEQLAELYATTRAHCYHIGGAARANDAVDVEKVRRLRAALR